MIRVMNILPEGTDLAPRLREMLRNYDTLCQALSPTLLGAFTAVKIGSALGKEVFDCIHAYNLKDAMAAISGRKISKGGQPKVVVEISPNTEIPKSIPADIRAAVDAWVFPSQRLRDRYPKDLKNPVVIPPANFELNWSDINPTTDQSQYAWIGNLDQNITRLKSAIEIIDRMAGEAKFRICGTGKARYVMDAVRKSRGMDHPERVEWLGENYDLVKILPCVNSIIQAGQDPINAESEASARGWQLLIPQASQFVPSDAQSNTQDNYIQELTNLYNSLR
ncbi:MAG: hypothetical protein LIP09_04305 [Bacteroidales bacterium]|nr:hypothetical protein [Bacteroidales bacterium]